MKGLIAFWALLLSFELAASTPFGDKHHLGQPHYNHGLPLEHHKFDQYHHNGHYVPQHRRAVAESSASSSASSSVDVHNNYPEHYQRLKYGQQPHPYPIHGLHPLPQYPLHKFEYPRHAINPHHGFINHHGIKPQWPEHAIPHHLRSHGDVEIRENFERVYNNPELFVERSSFAVPEYEERTIVEEEIEVPVRERETFVIEQEPIIEEKIKIPLPVTDTIILIETGESCEGPQRPQLYNDREIIQKEYRSPVVERLTITEQERPPFYAYPQRVVKDRFEEPVDERIEIERNSRYEGPAVNFEVDFRAPLADRFSVEREAFESPASYKIGVEPSYYQPQVNDRVIRESEEKTTTFY